MSRAWPLIGAALAAAAPALAQPAPVVGKVVRVDPMSDTARELPEDAARLGRGYAPASGANLALVTRAAADLRGAAGSTALLEPLGFGSVPLSVGRFPAGLPGTLQDGRMPIANVRNALKACAAQAPESLGAMGGRELLLVRINCAGRTDEFKNVYAAFAIEKGKLAQLVLNIGDLPNFVIAPATSAAAAGPDRK